MQDKYIIKTTEQFRKCLKKIAKQDQFRVLARLDRIAADGNFGDFKWFGDIGELRLHYGAGYRVYYTIKNGCVVIALVAGNKSTQTRDIEKARKILGSIEQ